MFASVPTPTRGWLNFVEWQWRWRTSRANRGWIGRQALAALRVHTCNAPRAMRDGRHGKEEAE